MRWFATLVSVVAPACGRIGFATIDDDAGLPIDGVDFMGVRCARRLP